MTLTRKLAESAGYVDVSVTSFKQDRDWYARKRDGQISQHQIQHQNVHRGSWFLGFKQHQPIQGVEGDTNDADDRESGHAYGDLHGGEVR